MRPLLYRQVLKHARAMDNHSPTKVLLSALPDKIWSRSLDSIVFVDKKKDDVIFNSTSVQNFTPQDISNYLNDNFSLDALLSAHNNGAEFYLPSSSNCSSLTSLVVATRRRAQALRSKLSEAAEEEHVEMLDSFFDALGFSSMREGSSLLEASGLIFSSSPTSVLDLPFQLERSSSTPYKYKIEESYADWDELILLTHPTACLGQEILHGSIVVMTKGALNADELMGLVVNKPWTQFASNKGREGEGSVLREFISAKELARFYATKDPAVVAMLDVELYQGGPVPTSLMVLHEIAEDDERSVEQHMERVSNDETTVGSTGHLCLTVVERVADLTRMIQKKELNPYRCKLFVGLCVWNRDQLGVELERNVWIQTKAKNEKHLSSVALMNLSSVEKSWEDKEKTATTTTPIFSDECWRGAVSQLGGEFHKIASSIEIHHDTMWNILGHQTSERVERLVDFLEEREDKEEEEEEEEDDDKRRD